MEFSGSSPVEGTTISTVSSEGIKFEQLDYPPLALNLCIRRNRSSSPCPEGAHHDIAAPKPTTPLTSHRMESDSSETGSVTSDPLPYADFGCTRPKVKPTRPFKAYTKDPLFLSVGLAASVNSPPLTPDLSLSKDSIEAYVDFRQRMLTYVKATNPTPGVTNAKMRRTTVQTPLADGKDASYWEKRRKNNEAAKRSRDARRAKEDEIAIRAAFLEQENLKLKYEVAALRNETAKLRCLLYN